MRRRSSAFGELPKFPNETSSHNTPACLIIEEHYGRLQLSVRWTWERYARLCQFLNMTPWEVASLAMIPHTSIARFREDNRLNGFGCRSQLLLLTLLEAHVCGQMSGDVIANPFPKLP